MKIIFLVPEVYSLKFTLKNAFESLGHNVVTVNYWDFFSDLNNKVFNKTNQLPIRLRKPHVNYYKRKIARKYLEIVYNEKPDLVFVYNDQFLDFNTTREIKKLSKIFFFLGDNPYYLNYNTHDFMPAFYEADYIFSPDSYWRDYFIKTGYKNIELLFFGYDKTINHPQKINSLDIEKYGSDLVMIGRMYSLRNWGYKRARFYNLFSNLNLKIFGHKGWEEWFDVFPKLKDKVILLKERLSFKEVNTILNCSKIYPIENNPGLIYGIHLRVFDAIGSGILPLPEYQKDYDVVFDKVKIPVIKNYDNAERLAKYYLENDNQRITIIKELREFLNEYYTPEIAVKKIIEKV